VIESVTVGAALIVAALASSSQQTRAREGARQMGAEKGEIMPLMPDSLGCEESLIR
jgi:hypothetical protein